MAHRLRLPDRADKKCGDPVTATTRLAFPDARVGACAAAACARRERDYDRLVGDLDDVPIDVLALQLDSGRSSIRPASPCPAR
jgi:hypothetical protein